MKTYLLSKFLPLIFSPLGIVLLLLLIFIFTKRKKFIYSAFFLLFAFSNGILTEGLLRYLEYPWVRQDYKDLKYSDGIVVLSSGRHLPPGNSKIIEWYDPDRFISGVNLYKANKSNKLIFTGGANPYASNIPPEGDIYIKEAISMGIPKENLFTTGPVFNTLQEAKAINKLLNNEFNSSQKKIILVTSAFHMKRAKKLFEREGMNVIPYPVDFKSSKNFVSKLITPIQWMPSANNLSASSMAVREIIGRIIYRVEK